jgi:hypothetical protein
MTIPANFTKGATVYYRHTLKADPNISTGLTPLSRAHMLDAEKWNTERWYPESEVEALRALLWEAKEWLRPDEDSPENRDKLYAGIIDALKEKK